MYTLVHAFGKMYYVFVLLRTFTQSVEISTCLYSCAVVCMFVFTCAVVHTNFTNMYRALCDVFVSELSEKLNSELSELRVTYYQLKEEHEQLQDKMKFYSKVRRDMKLS